MCILPSYVYIFGCVRARVCICVCDSASVSSYICMCWTHRPVFYIFTCFTFSEIFLSFHWPQKSNNISEMGAHGGNKLIRIEVIPVVKRHKIKSATLTVLFANDQFKVQTYAECLGSHSKIISNNIFFRHYIKMEGTYQKFHFVLYCPLFNTCLLFCYIGHFLNDGSFWNTMLVIFPILSSDDLRTTRLLK